MLGRLRERGEEDVKGGGRARTKVSPLLVGGVDQEGRPAGMDRWAGRWKGEGGRASGEEAGVGGLGVQWTRGAPRASPGPRPPAPPRPSRPPPAAPSPRPRPWLPPCPPPPASLRRSLTRPPRPAATGVQGQLPSFLGKDLSGGSGPRPEVQAEAQAEVQPEVDWWAPQSGLKPLPEVEP